MYKGAKWLGAYPLSVAGKNINTGDIATDMTEDEAKYRRGFEPVYEGESKESKKTEKKKRKEGDE